MTMTRQERINQAMQDVLIELARAEHLHPIWPGVGRMGDHIATVSKLAEETGEAVQAANNYDEGKGTMGHIRKELVQAGAMVLRNLINLELVEIHRINGQRRTGYDDQPPSLDTACDLDDEPDVLICGSGCGLRYLEVPKTKRKMNDSEWWADDNPICYPQQQEGLTIADYSEGGGVE